MLPCATLLVAALAQVESPPADDKKPAPPTTTEPAVITVSTFSDAQATQAIAQWKSVSAKAALSDRVSAIDALVAGSHVSLIPVLDRIVRTDNSVAVRKKAAEALGWQPPKKAYDAVVALLDDGNVGKVAELLDPLVKSLSRLGYKAKNWGRLETVFRAGYAANRINVQRAIIVLAGEQKEKQALALLLENFDEPVPRDVHGASNPPVEYWEARWKAWKAWRQDVKTAVQSITGQKFASADEARAWLRTNGAKLGLKGF